MYASISKYLDAVIISKKKKRNSVKINNVAELYEIYKEYLDDITFEFEDVFPVTEVGGIYSIIKCDTDCVLANNSNRSAKIATVYLLGNGQVTFEGRLREVVLASNKKLINLDCKELESHNNEFTSDCIVESKIDKIYIREYPFHMATELVNLAKNAKSTLLSTNLYLDPEGELKHLVIDLAGTEIVDLRINGTFELVDHTLEIINSDSPINSANLKYIECTDVKIVKIPKLPNLKEVYYRCGKTNSESPEEFKNLF